MRRVEEVGADIAVFIFKAFVHSRVHKQHVSQYSMHTSWNYQLVAFTVEAPCCEHVKKDMVYGVTVSGPNSITY